MTDNVPSSLEAAEGRHAGAAPYVLAFDTANEAIALGLGRLLAQGMPGEDAPTVDVVLSLEVEARRASNTQLLPRIDAALAAQGVEKSEIACVVCGRGPGSFTGVRIALATAKGMASALGVPLVGVSSLDAVAWGAWHAGVRGSVLVVADAMRKEVYPVRFAVSDAGIDRLEADRVVRAVAAAEELCATGDGSLLIAGDALGKYAELFAPCGTLLPEGLWAPTGRGLLLALQAAWRAGAADPFDARRHAPAFALPVYTRLSDAEENERLRLAKNEPKNLIAGVQDATARKARAEGAASRATLAPATEGTAGAGDSAGAGHAADACASASARVSATACASDPACVRTSMHDASPRFAPADAQGVSYRPLDAAHVAEVSLLESRVMGTDAWSEALVADELARPDRVWWMAVEDAAACPSESSDAAARPSESDDAAACPSRVPGGAASRRTSKPARLLGYAGGWVVDGGLQILKVGVAHEARRRGIARELLSRVAADARDLGAATCSLEVRAGNEGAQAFYESLGFARIGARPRYYSDREDAVIMEGPLPLASRDVAGMALQVDAARADALLARDWVQYGKKSPICEVSSPCSASLQEITPGRDSSLPDSAGENPANRAFSAASDDEARQDAPQPAADVLAAARPLILAIESSCDETAAAIVDGTGNLVADVVASQIDFHARFGGVVPEIASRKHIEAICGVCDECLDVAAAHLGVARLTWSDLDAVAVTYAPGLVGALVVGVAFAKGAAWAADKPFIGVNHLEGHLYANKIGTPDFEPPAVVSLVSGGNTLLVHMKGWGDYETLGATIDDAVGEAFDKVAKALGLGYPGGPVVSKLAAQGDPAAIPFPRAMLHSGDLRFSLSGLKTAVVTYLNNERAVGHEPDVADVCASFQQAVVDVQVAKARTALEQTGAPTFCLGGGVAANPVLRAAYERLCAQMGVRLVLPPLSACGDNAGMIALVALDRYRQGRFFGLNADAQAHASLDEPY